MDLLELARMRYSARKYEETKVEDQKILKILEAGRVAPTAHNNQPQRLVVVKEQEGLKKLKKSGNVYGAPLAIVVCSDRDVSWKRPYDGKSTADIDASIVTAQMMLEATSLGLGTIWVCFFDPIILRQEFNIPDNYEPVNILGVGYASGPSKSIDRFDKERNPLEDTVFYETF
jgi:nitroreductase